MRDCYSPLKIFHHQDRIDDLRNGRRPRLLHCQIIPTNRCNQNCEFCAYRLEGYLTNEQFDRHDEIPFAKLCEIIADCQVLGIGAIELTGGGEPTLHPKFGAICREIIVHGMDFGLVTNGTAITEEIFTELRNASWVRVSIDAGDPAMYARIRRTTVSNFARARDAIRALKDLERPIIGVGFVVTRENWRGILQAAINAKRDGADNFRVSAVFQPEGVEYFREFHDAARDLCAAAKSLEDDSFVVFNLFGNRIEDLRQQSPANPFCPLQQLATYVGADLNVYRCCNQAYNRAGLIGSLRDQSFREFWESDRTGHLLTHFDARKCQQCMFNEKNATIRYAIQKRPLHANFL